MVKVDFEIQTERGVFRDSIVYMEENLSEEQIENIKQQRLNEWLKRLKHDMDTPPTETYNSLMFNSLQQLQGN